MEAVPKLPMVCFELKTIGETTSFNNLKGYIAECYQEDPDSYTKEIYALESLRNSACRPERDINGCNTLKRYYCQLHSLHNRFPNITEKQLLTFSWCDNYTGKVLVSNDMSFEMSTILYNLGCLHTVIGGNVDRDTPDGMKSACTHFQCAAWAFNEVKEKYAEQFTNYEIPIEVLLFQQQLCLAQAQECILEKSLLDNRKPAIVAKVTAQVITYYNSAIAILAGGEDSNIVKAVGKKMCNEWKRFVNFKASYMSAILLLHQGQQTEDEQKMGERVILFETALEKIDEANKESKNLTGLAKSFQERLSEAITFVHDIIEVKRKTAKSENEFIYHEQVPDISSIAAVQGADLVKGIGFSLTDPDVTGTDIFSRLIPMKAHEASSLYSEEKAKLIRRITSQMEEKDSELNKYLGTLNMEFFNGENQSNKLPQTLVDRCAALNAKPNAIANLVKSMSSLADICIDVESMLNEIKQMLQEEDAEEKTYQQKMGPRPAGHFTELNREFLKYQEAHNKAGESNETLRKAMGLHVNNLKILSQPLSDLQKMVPCWTEDQNDPAIGELKTLLNKVTEMCCQRGELIKDLQDSVSKDDITSKIILSKENNLEDLFRTEISKFDKSVALIEQNFKAQQNIIKAVTSTYAKCAQVIKAMGDTKHKREHFFSSMISSYDIYEDLLGKSAKGLEFYKKLQGNVQKLLSRVKSARDVQAEERQQLLTSTKPPTSVIATHPTTEYTSIPTKTGTTPKLRDYLNKKDGKNISSYTAPDSNIPSVRPSPVGSETTVAPVCYSNTLSMGQYDHNYDPPPVYTPYNNQYGYDPSLAMNQDMYPSYSQPELAGYMNPLYNNQKMYNNIMNPSDQPINPIDQSVYYATEHTAVSATVTDVPTAPAYQNATIPGHYESQYQSVTPTSNYLTSKSMQSYNNYSLPDTQYGQSSYQSYVPPLSTSQPNNQINYGHVPYSSQTSNNNQQQINQPFVVNSSNAATLSEQLNYDYRTANTSYDIGAINPSLQSNAIVQNFQPQSDSSYTYSSIIPNNNMQQNITGYYSQQPPSMDTSNPVSLPPSINQNESNFYIGTTVAQSGGTNPAQPELKLFDGAIVHHSMGAISQDFEKINIANATFNDIDFQETYLNSNQTLPQIFDNQSVSYASLTPQSESTVNLNPAVMPNPVNYYQPPSSNSTIQDITNVQYNQLNPNFGNIAVHTTYDLPMNVNPTFDDNFSGIKSHADNDDTEKELKTSTNTSQQLYYQPATYDIQQNAIYSTNTGISTYNSPAYVMPPNYETGQFNNQVDNTSVAVSNTGTESTMPSTPKTSDSTNKNVSNIDLLSGIDFCPSNIPTSPVLQPSPVSSIINNSSKITETDQNKSHERVLDVLPLEEKVNLFLDQQQHETNKPVRNSSFDNLSTCSDLSSIDANSELESASVVGSKIEQNKVHSKILDKFSETPDNGKFIKLFHKDVERYERQMEMLNVKMLNGSTPLDGKWKELQDSLVKDEGKRLNTVAKLFPEKNRSVDSIPYDHARVLLPTTTDNYINAAYVKDIAPNCPTFIIAQTPMPNTIKDFWLMVFSEKIGTIVCLHTPSEILDPYWPLDINRETSYGEVNVTVLKQFDFSHCSERNLKIQMNGSEDTLNVSLVQIKSWNKQSSSNIIEIASNIMTIHQQNQKTAGPIERPLLLSCLTGSDRSGSIAVGIISVAATSAKRPSITNVVDVWYRLCSQRKGCLKDITLLELSMQIVLAGAHKILNNAGIMTSYQMKHSQSVTVAEKTDVNDLFSDLDPLWKLKKK